MDQAVQPQGSHCAMNFTGTELIHTRNFYTQTGQTSIAFDCTIQSATGIYRFGVSGFTGMEFVLNNGQISYNNLFLGSYRAYEDFGMILQFSSGFMNVSQGGIPLIYGQPRPTGNINTVYFGRDDPASQAVFTFEVSGNNVPKYLIDTQGYLTSTGQTSVTGLFHNLGSYPIYVFDSTATNLQGLSLSSLTGNITNSGAFSFGSDYSTFDFTQPFVTTFHTNFGDAGAEFIVVDLRSLNNFVLLGNIADYSFNSSNVLNRTLSYQNFSGGVITNNFETYLYFNLSYITGTATGVFSGNWDLSTGIDQNSLISLRRVGNFSTGVISGAGVFPPNSSLNFQLNHLFGAGDTVLLNISGSGVVNPILQTLYN